MAFRPLRILLPVLLLAAGGAGFAALKASRPERQPVPSEERAWLVSIETVKPAALAPTVALFGRVDSPRLASLSAAITADVVEVPVLEGERVEAGALLVRLDDRDMVLERLQREADVADIRAQLEAERQRFERDQASLANEKALLALTERAVRRAEELASTRVGSAAQLDDARQAAERQRMALADRRFAVREHDARRQQLEARLARAEALLGKAVLDNHFGWFEAARDWPLLKDLDPHRRSSVLFDTVAVYLAFAEDWLEMETLPIIVSDDGRTLIDDAGRPTRCATGWRDREAFLDFVTERLT